MTKQTRQKAQIHYFHGFPIWYRVENRAGIQTLILSLREESKPTRIIYEGNPQRFPKGSDGDVDRGLELLVPKFLEQCFGLSIQENKPQKEGEAPDALEVQKKEKLLKERLARRKKYAEDGALTFGVMWELYAAHQKHCWNRETSKKKAWQMRPLLKKFHERPFKDVTPVECSSILDKLSYDRHSACVNLIGEIWEFEQGVGIYMDQENPWTEYGMRGRRKPGKTTANLGQKELTMKQCRDIMEQCYTIMKKCKEQAVRRGNSSIYLLTAFLLLMGLPLKELCALTLENVKPLKELKGFLVIEVNQELRCAEEQKQYKRCEISELYRKRTLILPDTLATLCKMFWPELDSNSPKAISKGKCCPPLFPDSKNATHRMRPDAASKELNKIFGKICGNPEFGTKLSVEKWLIKTAQVNFPRCGLTDEEMDYHFGWTPKTTAAKSYNDFVNASQFNRRRHILERWAWKICPSAASNARDEKKTRNTGGGQAPAWFAEPGKLCIVQTDLEIKSVDTHPTGPTLECYAPGGFRNLKIEIIKEGGN